MQNIKKSFFSLKLFQLRNSCFSTSQVANLNHIFIPAKDPIIKPFNLVVLHGLLGSASNFRGIVNNPKISSLANSYLLDLRNHGSSEHRDTMTSTEMASDVYSFIQKNNLSSNLVIMGHSMGARVSMTFCCQYPEILKAAIIVDLAPHEYRSDPRFNAMQETEELLKKLVKIDMNQDYKTVSEEIKKAAGNKTVGEFVMTNLKRDENGHYQWKSNLQAILQNYQEVVGKPEGTGKFTGPVKVIFGEKSNYYHEDLIPKFSSIFPKFNKDKDLSVIKDANHWVHFAKPVEFIEVVSNFLKEVADDSN